MKCKTSHNFYYTRTNTIDILASTKGASQMSTRVKNAIYRPLSANCTYILHWNGVLEYACDSSRCCTSERFDFLRGVLVQRQPRNLPAEGKSIAALL